MEIILGESAQGWFSDQAPDLAKLIISSFTAAGATWIPTIRDSSGTVTPTVVFDGQPYLFQAFVILIMFAFTASICTLYSYNRPPLAKFFRACSTVVLSCAASVLIISVLSGFKASASAQNFSQ